MKRPEKQTFEIGESGFSQDGDDHGQGELGYCQDDAADDGLGPGCQVGERQQWKAHERTADVHHQKHRQTPE